MEQSAVPEFNIGPMRILTQPQISYFYVTNQPTAFANLDRDLDILLSELEEAKRQANLVSEAGPDIVRYYKADADTQAGETDLYWMEVGIPVKEGTPAVGKALVKTLPPYRCAALLLWGSLAHIGQAYETLMQSIQQAGLERTGECREWNFWFEAVDSPNNLLGLFMGLR